MMTQAPLNWPAYYRDLTTHELIARTYSLQMSARWGAALDQDGRFAALAVEQNLRCVADVADAHVLAGRENIARSMATEDLQDMLPDFEQDAAVCGIRPEQAATNKQIVIDELRRRGIEAIGRREPFTLDEVRAEDALDEYLRGDPNA